MHSIGPILPILQHLDGAALTPEAFVLACVTLGWNHPIDDGIGLWEATHAVDDTLLILDTITDPTTLLCRIDGIDDYEPDALEFASDLRHCFDVNFDATAEVLRTHFAQSLGESSYDPPYHWRFAHFCGTNSRVALEQSYYDPQMGVQLLLLLQPLPKDPSDLGRPITSSW